jgi:hypothetical protein
MSDARAQTSSILTALLLTALATSSCTLLLDTGLDAPAEGPTDRSATDLDAGSDVPDRGPDDSGADLSGDGHTDSTDDPATDLDADAGDLAPCDGGPANPCGGCHALEAEPGDSCESSCGPGHWVCDGPDALACQPDEGLNACGGCGELSAEPGTSCGPCTGDVYECAGPEHVECLSHENDCGGCAALEGVPGTGCGDCGEWACSGSDLVVCEGDHPLNGCEGCDTLEGEPMAECGTCGHYECLDSDTVECRGEHDPNLCAGCDALEGTPGETCICAEGDAEWMCRPDGEAVLCTDGNDTPASAEPISDFPLPVPFESTSMEWLHDANDVDWLRIGRVDDDYFILFTPSASAEAVEDPLPDDFVTCVLYVYNDDRGADIYPFTCSGTDQCSHWDGDASALVVDGEPGADCGVAPVGFEPGADVAGCCGSTSAGMGGLGTSHDDSGTAFFLFASPSASCLEYEASGI